jgi:hypothetical protein
VLGRHPECRGEAVRALEIAGALVATNTHRDGGSAAAALAGMFGTVENMVRSVGGIARTASSTAGEEAGEDLAKATRFRGNHAINAHPNNDDDAATLVGLVREGRYVVKLVQTPSCGSRDRASVSENMQKVAI